MTLDEYLKLLKVGEVETTLYCDSALKVSAIDVDERTVTAIISTGVVDRDKEVLLPKGVQLEQFQKNPVVPWSHQSFEPPIGRALWVKKGREKITAKIKFATTERAEEVWELFKGGFLKAFSVGFQPIKGHAPTPDEIKKKPEWAEARWIFDEWELLEFSPVTVPANPEALALAVKNKELVISEDLQKELEVDINAETVVEMECEKIIEVEEEKVYAFDVEPPTKDVEEDYGAMVTNAMNKLYGKILKV